MFPLSKSHHRQERGGLVMLAVCWRGSAHDAFGFSDEYGFGYSGKQDLIFKVEIRVMLSNFILKGIL